MKDSVASGWNCRLGHGWQRASSLYLRRRITTKSAKVPGEEGRGGGGGITGHLKPSNRVENKSYAHMAFSIIARTYTSHFLTTVHYTHRETVCWTPSR